MKAISKKCLALLLALAMVLSILSVSGVHVRAEEPAGEVVNLDVASTMEGIQEIGEYMYEPVWYLTAPEGTNQLTFTEFDEEAMYMGLIAGMGEGNVVTVTGDFRATWETLTQNDTIEFYEGAEDLDYSNAYFVFIADADYEVMMSFIIQIPQPQGEEKPFTVSAGEITEYTEGGYSFTDWSGTPVTVDLYTVTVPYGNPEITLDFGEKLTISYNYDEAGNYISGEYADPTAGETQTTKKIDSDGDGVNDYIWVQNPYNADWSGGELLYVIRFITTYTFEIFDQEGNQLTEISFVPDVYSYYDYMTGKVSTVGAYAVTIPMGLETVDITFSDNVLCYNYTKDGTYLGGYYSDFMTGGREALDVPVDYGDSITPADGELDYIQVQTPYDEAYNSTLMYTITFKYEPAVSYIDVYEMLVQKAAEVMSDPASAAYGAGDWFAFAMGRDGREVPMTYLNSVVDTINANEGVLHTNAYNFSNYSRTILALAAAGMDPETIGYYDILNGLSGLENVTGQGSNGAMYALLALDSCDFEIPQAEEGVTRTTREALVQDILDNHLEDGGWAYSSPAYPATASDPDLTALALCALAPYLESNATAAEYCDAALAWLSAQQNADGTYSSWGDVNAESTAQVLIALLTLGIDPTTDARFIKNDVTLADALCSFALEDGMAHVRGGAYNGLATVQSYYALAAFMRFLDGMKPLYDMSDVTLETFTIEHDGNYHWTENSDGTLIFGKEEHSFNEEGTCEICGAVQVYGLNILEESIVLETMKEDGSNAENATMQLTVVLDPEGASAEDLVWSSTNDEIASVDSHGVVTAHTYGRVIITASTADGVLSDSCAVRTLFYDVTEESVSSGAFKCIYWAADNDITRGFDNVYFGPEQNCTREQFTIFLWRAAGKPAVTQADIDEAKEAFGDAAEFTSGGLKCVAWAYKNGIIKGYSDGSFKPTAGITRQEIVIMLWRAAGKPDVAQEEIDAVEEAFSDVAEFSAGGLKTAAWGVKNGLIKGYDDGTFKPGDQCTRASLVVMLWRAVDKGFVGK